jgi:hypothetical protein
MKRIVSFNNFERLSQYLNNINIDSFDYDLILDKKDFENFWNCGFIEKYFEDTGQLLDDYKTTSIVNREHLFALQKNLNKIPNKVFKGQFRAIIHFALENNSGLVFEF